VSLTLPLGCASAPPSAPTAAAPALPADSGPPSPATEAWQGQLDALVDTQGTVAGAVDVEGDGYRIGEGDELAVEVFGADALSARTRVGAEGDISLPLLGPVTAAGLTPLELERRVEERLSTTYMKDPHVRVDVVEMRSRAVSVIGAVRRPGVYQVTGRATLLSVLAMAEGLAEDAGGTVLIARGSLARQDSLAPGTPDHAVGLIDEVDLQALFVAGDRRLDVPVGPGDIVNVQPAGIVYVMGEVNRPGGFTLSRGEPLSVLQALALAQGLGPTAAAGRSLIIRDAGNGEKQEIPVDLDDVLSGSEPPHLLASNDVLFVPNNTAKSVAKGVVDAMVRMFTFRGLIY
jgi:polysaccharide export outer membrane protein